MYKKITFILLILISLLTLVACNENNKNNDSKNTESEIEVLEQNIETDDEDIVPYLITNEANNQLVFRSERSEDLEEAIEFAKKDLSEFHTSKQATYDRLYNEHEFTVETAKKAIESIEWDYKENAFKTAEYIEESNNESLTSLQEALIGIFRFSKNEAEYAIQKMKDTDPMKNGVSRDFNSAKRFLEDVSKHQTHSKKMFESILFENLLFSQEATNYALNNVNIDYKENAYRTLISLKQEFSNKSDENLKKILHDEHLFSDEEIEFAYNKYLDDVNE